jgi:hypothetical protein
MVDLSEKEQSLSLRKAREAIRADDLETAWQHVFSVLCANPEHEDAAKLSRAVAKRLLMRLRQAVQQGRHDTVVNTALFMARIGSGVADALPALDASAQLTLDPEARLNLWRELARILPERPEPWDALADALSGIEPTPEALELGFEILHYHPGHLGALASLEALVVAVSEPVPTPRLY